MITIGIAVGAGLCYWFEVVRVGVLDSNLCDRLWWLERRAGDSQTQWVYRGCNSNRSRTELHDVISDKGSTHSVSDTRRLARWGDSRLSLNSN